MGDETSVAKWPRPQERPGAQERPGPQERPGEGSEQWEVPEEA